MIDCCRMVGLTAECLCFVAAFLRFDMPVPSITPELKKDLEILQVWCYTGSVILLAVGYHDMCL